MALASTNLCIDSEEHLTLPILVRYTMVHILGVNLPDRRLVKIALTAIEGIGHNTSKLICARLAFHDRLMVSDLSEPQINQLSALLSAPSSFMGPGPSTSTSSIQEQREHSRLQNLTITNDLRRQIKADIAHHRTVGNYRGRRHAMGLPVRGQRTKTNAKMAKRLNRVERAAYSTMATPRAAGSSSPSSSS